VSEMTHDEKLVFYATAPRAYADKINQVIDGDFVTSFVGKLRGKIVTHPTNGMYKFPTADEAKDCARAFRDFCRQKAKDLNVAV